MSMPVKFNGVSLNEILDVVQGFTPYGGADMEPTFSSTGSGGATFVSTTRKLKTLPMPFIIKSDKNGTQLKKYDLLQAVLNVDEPKPLEFGAMPNRVFYAIPSGDLSYTETVFQGTGTIQWIIGDGVAHASFKRRYPAALNKNGALEAVIYNNGTAAVPIDYYINHRYENGFVGIVSDHGVIQVGNTQETDKGVLPSKTILDLKASDKTLDNLPTGGGTFTENEFGTEGAWEHFTQGNRQFIKLDTTNTGKLVNTWHGSSKHTNLLDSNGDGLSDFTVDLRIWFLNANAQQKGLMQFLLVDATGTKKVGFSIDKGLPGNLAKIRLHNGETEGILDIDTGANDFVDLDHGQIIIEKTGNVLTYRFANRTVRYVVASIEKTRFTSINLLSATMGDSVGMSRLCWERVKVTKHYTDNNADIPNRFAANSQLYIDGKTSKVYYNDVQISDANGSKYFKAPPGETRVEFYYSDFSNPVPQIVCEIEEAWL